MLDPNGHIIEAVFRDIATRKQPDLVRAPRLSSAPDKAASGVPYSDRYRYTLGIPTAKPAFS